MNKKWFYIMALLSLPLLRVVVLNTGYDAWLLNANYTKAAAFITMLKTSELFQQFVGGWIFPCYVVGILSFWCMEEDDSRIGQQFVLLPLAYIPFTILGFTLVNAEFKVSYLYQHPLIVVTFGYLFVGFWSLILWLLMKIGIVK